MRRWLRLLGLGLGLLFAEQAGAADYTVAVRAIRDIDKTQVA